MIRILYFLLFSVILTSCEFITKLITEDYEPEPIFGELAFANNTADTIFVNMIPQRGNASFKPDVSMALGGGYSGLEMVCPDGVYEKGQVLHNKEYLDHIYNFMIFNKNTMDRYSREELIEKNIYDTMLVFRYEELKALDFKVVYTGDSKTGRM